ncbi:MAG: hypothetical protein LBC74_13565 [Planctomycetaceae bacterium]|jgi:hypothetical protein|nr:hypothetical protein [Planctomycetaceae bacterium]
MFRRRLVLSQKNVFLHVTVLFFILLLCCDICFGSGRDDRGTSESILSLKTRLKNYLALINGYEVHVITKNQLYQNPANKTELFEIRGIVGENNCLITEGRDVDLPDKAHYQRIIGTNEKYLFELTRGRNINDAWRVLNIIPNYWEKEIDLSDRLNPVIRKFFFAGGLELHDLGTVVDLLDNDKFEVTSSEQYHGGNNHLFVKVSFRNQSNNKQHKKFSYYPFQGELVFLLDGDYSLLKSANLMVRSDVENIAGIYKFDSDVAVRDDGICYISKCIVSYYKETSDSPVRTLERIYELTKQPSLEKSRFTLSHYGLPEPDFINRKISRSNLIIAGFGLLLIGISIWFHFQRRRRKT